MKNIYFFLVTIVLTSFGFGQTTASYNFADSGAVTGLNEAAPGISLDANIGFGSFKNSGTSNPGIFSNELRLYQNTTKGGSIKIYASNGVTITGVTFNTSRSGPAEYSVDGGSPISITAIGGVYTINGISSTSEVEFWCVGSSSSTRIYVDDFNVTYTSGGAPNTSVEFTSTTASVSEGIGTTDLNFSISNPDGSNATTFDVVLTSGDNADINSYTTQMVTFPAGSSTEETVTITVTDDLVFEGDEILTFEIQNVLGGNNAGVGANNAFDLTIEENDTDPSITIFIEDFDNSYPNWTNDIETQLFVDPSSPSEGLFIQSASSNNPNFTGNTVFGRDLAGESGEPTLSPYTFTFASVDISGFSSVVVSFDYHAFANAETGDYELVIDGIGQGSVEYFNDPDSSPGVNGTISIPVTNGTNTVGLILTGTLNGGNDIIEFDNFKITGVYSGLTFTGGSWTPMDPDNSTGASDAIVIDGTATFAADAALNDVNILPGAAVRVNSGVTLGTNTLGLKSTSSTFSSLIVDGTVTGTVAYERYVNSNDPINGNDLISAPLSGQNFNTFFGNNPNILSNPSGPEVLFGGFDNDDAVNPFELWNDTDTTPLVAGQGYRTGIDTAASANFVSFEGTVNTSEVLVAIDQGTASILNLVGNPFPSYLDAQAFLSENAGVLDGSAQVIYGYNDSTDGTSSDDYTIISLLENTSVNIAPGQAFFVASNSTGGNIAFTTSSPDMRITSDQDDFIVGRNAAATITNVNISLTNASDNFITKVYFTPSSGLGLDPGYDASLIGGVAPGFALFSNLVEDNMNVPFATQALGKNDYNDTTVALGVNANMGEQLTFSIAQSTLPAEIEVYLDDTITSTSTLLNASDYIITPDSNLNGTGRFYLRFSNSALSLPENNLDNITIYTNPANRTINISGQIEAGTMAKIYDIQGRLVKTEVLSSNVTLHSIDGNALHAGVYIVELSHDNQRKSEKLILR